MGKENINSKNWGQATNDIVTLERNEANEKLVQKKLKQLKIDTEQLQKELDDFPGGEKGFREYYSQSGSLSIEGALTTEEDDEVFIRTIGGEEVDKHEKEYLSSYKTAIRAQMLLVAVTGIALTEAIVGLYDMELLDFRVIAANIIPALIFLIDSLKKHSDKRKSERERVAMMLKMSKTKTPEKIKFER